MRGDPTKDGSGADSQIPWDLTEVVDSKTLSAWVREEIGSLNWTNPDLVEHLRVHPNYHPRMMLTVLTYAYASGVFESEEILRRCDVEAIYRGMCMDAAPESISATRWAHKVTRKKRSHVSSERWRCVRIMWMRFTIWERYCGV